MADLKAQLAELGGGWTISDGHLVNSYPFADFITALAFVNQIGGVAEAEGHHPNISFTWGRVDVEIWTHDQNALTVRDFSLARRISALRDA